jgi:hypothetical protein
MKCTASPAPQEGGVINMANLAFIIQLTKAHLLCQDLEPDILTITICSSAKGGSITGFIYHDRDKSGANVVVVMQQPLLNNAFLVLFAAQQNHHHPFINSCDCHCSRWWCCHRGLVVAV